MDEVTVITPDATATIPVPETETEEMEITSEWLESLFASLSNSLASMQSTIVELARVQQESLIRLQSLELRLPENLTQMISDQQQTITSLIAQSQETVRSLLTPPAQPVEIQTEPPSVVVENPVVRTELPEPPPRKRRKI